MNESIYKTQIPEKASISTKIIYAVGFTSSATLCYNAFYSYFLYYMTDVLHISAFIAGIISMIAITWDAISDPIIAYKSDKCRWKSGRRIPFMFIGVIVMSVAFTCIFTKMSDSPQVQIAWIIIMTLLYWTGATMYDISHNALGSELVSKHSERESLRVGTAIADSTGLLFIMVLIPSMTAFVAALTGSEAIGYQRTMMLIATVALVIGIITCITLRNKEPKIDWEVYDKKHAKEDGDGFFKTIKELFQLKPYPYLLAAVIVINLGSVCMQSSVVHFFTHVCHFNAAQQTIAFLVLYGTGLIWGIFIAAFLQKKLGSRNIFIGGLALTIISMIIFPNFTDVTNLAVICVYVFLVAMGSRVLWLYCYIYAYGIAMLDNIKNDKHREGNVVGYMSLGLKIGSAIATFSIGTVLAVFGYDGQAAAQTSEAIFGIRMANSVLPAILMLIGMIIIIKYPMKDKDTVAIEKAIKARDAGEPYSTEEFKHLL